MTQCVKWACDSISFNMCCYSTLWTNHIGCLIMTLNFIIPWSSFQSKASLILLNIYYSRFSVFKKGIFKEIFKKRAHCRKTFGGRQTPPTLYPLLRRAWFFKIGCPKNLTIFWIKKILHCEIFKSIFLIEHLWWLVLHFF